MFLGFACVFLEDGSLRCVLWLIWNHVDFLNESGYLKDFVVDFLDEKYILWSIFEMVFISRVWG